MPNHFLTDISVQSSMCSKSLVLLALLKPRKCVFLWGERTDYYFESFVFIIIITITGWLMPFMNGRERVLGKATSILHMLSCSYIPKACLLWQNKTVNSSMWLGWSPGPGYYEWSGRSASCQIQALMTSCPDIDISVYCMFLLASSFRVLLVSER